LAPVWRSGTDLLSWLVADILANSYVVQESGVMAILESVLFGSYVSDYAFVSNFNLPASVVWSKNFGM
jgi:hypothetical protein